MFFAYDTNKNPKKNFDLEVMVLFSIYNIISFTWHI